GRRAARGARRRGPPGAGGALPGRARPDPPHAARVPPRSPPAPGRGAGARAVGVVSGAFGLSSPPLSRVVIVRRVARLEDAVTLLHRGVSTAGIHPERRRLALRDAVAARGVSNVVSLGHAERAFAGMPHDGMRVLSDLVEWTNGWAGRVSIPGRTRG